MGGDSTKTLGNVIRREVKPVNRMSGDPGLETSAI